MERRGKQGEASKERQGEEVSRGVSRTGKQRRQARRGKQGVASKERQARRGKQGEASRGKQAEASRGKQAEDDWASKGRQIAQAIGISALQHLSYHPVCIRLVLCSD
jgi:hypothetical protein